MLQILDHDNVFKDNIFQFESLFFVVSAILLINDDIFDISFKKRLHGARNTSSQEDNKSAGWSNLLGKLDFVGAMSCPQISLLTLVRTFLS